MRLGHLKYIGGKVSEKKSRLGLVGGRAWCQCNQVGPKKHPNIVFLGSPGAEKAGKISQIVLTSLVLAS
jgi:hypothetical protein